MAEIVLVSILALADGTFHAKEVETFRWFRQCELASKGRMMYTPNINYVCIERVYDESRKDMGNN